VLGAEEALCGARGGALPAWAASSMLGTREINMSRRACLRIWLGSFKGSTLGYDPLLDSNTKRASMRAIIIIPMLSPSAATKNALEHEPIVNFATCHVYKNNIPLYRSRIVQAFL
jgi:hypothetical protein